MKVLIIGAGGPFPRLQSFEVRADFQQVQLAFSFPKGSRIMESHLSFLNEKSRMNPQNDLEIGGWSYIGV
jgi:hypothetical protein